MATTRLEAATIRSLGRAIQNGQGFDFPSTGGGPPFVGDGSGITNLNASELTSGTVPSARMPYKIYRALLNQSGTAAPVATVLENTLGGSVVWTRGGVGRYSGTLSGAFTASKTMVFIQSPTAITDGTSLGAKSSTTSVVDVASDFVDVSAPGANPADDLLIDTALEILVYP